MAIEHKFRETTFGVRGNFSTLEAILDTTPFKPEVLFLGTFNPDTAKDANKADFFYGRNWFWSAMFNIFDCNFLFKTRRDAAIANNQPSLNDILLFCQTYKITFADLISSVLHNGNPNYDLTGNIVSYDGNNYDLINDDDLGRLNRNGQVEWSTKILIAYLEKTDSIKTVYLTRQPVEPFATQWYSITSHNYGRKISFRNIYTPSGQRLPGTPRINHLMYHWLFNDSPDYDKIDIDWLRRYNPNFDAFAENIL